MRADSFVPFGSASFDSPTLPSSSFSTMPGHAAWALESTRRSIASVMPRVSFVALALVLWIPLNFHFAGSTLGPWIVRPLWVRLFDGAHVGAAVLAARQAYELATRG